MILPHTFILDVPDMDYIFKQHEDNVKHLVTTEHIIWSALASGGGIQETIGDICDDIEESVRMEAELSDDDRELKLEYCHNVINNSIAEMAEVILRSVQPYAEYIQKENQAISDVKIENDMLIVECEIIVDTPPGR